MFDKRYQVDRTFFTVKNFSIHVTLRSGKPNKGQYKLDFVTKRISLKNSGLKGNLNNDEVVAGGSF